MRDERTLASGQEARRAYTLLVASAREIPALFVIDVAVPRFAPRTRSPEPGATTAGSPTSIPRRDYPRRA